MSGKRVIYVSVWADPVSGNVMDTMWRRPGGLYGRSIRSELPERVVRKATKVLYERHRGTFRPFLAGCPGWTWTP